MAAIVAVASSASAIRAQPPPSEWSTFVTFREAHQFDRTTNGVPREDRITDSVNASLTYSTVRERSKVSLFARVGTNVPREESRRQRINFGAGFGWNYRASERFQSTLTQNVSRNFRLETLAELGLVDPSVTSYSASTQWSTRYDASSRTTMSTSLRYRFQEIESDEPIFGSQIVLDEQPFGDDLSPPGGVFEDVGDTGLTLRDGETDILDILASEGLDETSERSQSAFASAGLSHATSERTTIGVDATAGYRTFRSGLEGSAAAMRFYLQRAIGRVTSASVNYTVQRSLVLLPETTLQTLYGGVSTSGQDRPVSLTLFGGLSHYTAEGAVSQLTPVANVSLTGALTSSTTAGLSYRRQFSSTLGFGRTLLTDFVGAGLSQELGSRANMRLHAGATFSTDPLNVGRDSNSRRVGGSLSARIVGGLRAGTSLFVTRSEWSNLDTATVRKQKTWSFYLTYGTSWH